MNAYEQSVLGAMMLDASSYWQVADLISSSDFADERHERLFDAMAEMAKAGKPIDAVTMGDVVPELAHYLVGIADATPSAANIRAYAEEVRKASEVRRVKRQAADGAPQFGFARTQRSRAPAWTSVLDVECGMTQTAHIARVNATVYYNEIDPYCAAWLQNLMDAGHIAPGVIDTRSIEDVRPDELAGYTQCHFFAGLGGWPHALALAGWQADRPVWTGSCPCQPFSVAGKGAGTSDQRHLWPAWFHLIAQCRPPVIFGEQVANAIGHGWLDGTFADLEGQGYACGAAVLSASAADAPHRRDRLWIVADAEWNKQPRQEPCIRPDRRVGREQQLFPWEGGWQRALARFRALDNGIPRCVAGTDAARNAIVPQAAQAFIESYCEARGLIGMEAAA